MCALPLPTREKSSGPTSNDQGFWTRFAALEAKYLSLWERTGEEFPVLGNRTSRIGRYANFRHCRKFIDRLAGKIVDFPADEAQRHPWRHEIKREIQRFGEERFDWPRGYRDLLVSEDFYDSTVRFVRCAREFDPEIAGPDVAQALRNVWIVNSLQMLLDQEVSLTPAVFAYSMLYPYTDNFLDDPGVPAEQKRSLNENLGRWLAGNQAVPTDDYQNDVCRLVGMIENQFTRDCHGPVFSSLLAIHAGQEESLCQQDSQLRLKESDVLAITFRKGGSSVLADGYLAAGRLSPSEEDFCFGYGVFLQLLDDLQDVQADLQAGHETLFTRIVTQGPLDGITSRLYHFMHAVVRESERFAASRFEAHRDLILRNCVFLLVGAVAESETHFSRSFRCRLEKRWRLSFAASRRLRHRGSRKFKAAANALRRARGMETIFDLDAEMKGPEEI